MSNLKSSCRQHHWFIAALNANKSVCCVFFCLLSLFSFNSEKPKLWIIIRRICAVICLRQFIEFMLLIWKRRKKIVFKFTFGFKFGFGWWCWFHKETTRQSLFSSLSTHKMAQNHFCFFVVVQNFKCGSAFNWHRIYMYLIAAANLHCADWFGTFSLYEACDNSLQQSRDTEPLKSNIITYI